MLAKKKKKETMIAIILAPTHTMVSHLPKSIDRVVTL